MTLPLSGVRIVELGQLIAIPAATKLLADMGAETIRVESCSRLELYRTISPYDNSASGEYWNRAANFYEQNRNKLGVTLDLGKPKGIEALKDLVSISDVFAENFTPRVMANFSLEYEDLRACKPDIIMVSSTGYGYTGPWSGFGAIGYATEAASGLTHVTGYKGGPPVLPEIPYSDYPAAEHAAFAIVAALFHRARTGRGQLVDVSHAETMSSQAPEALMDYTVNGRTMERYGNEDPAMAPHGCYPCRGNDRWVVIAVSTDAEWSSLCDTLRVSGWRRDPRFSDRTSRRSHRAELDALIREVTREWDHYELMYALQAAGVPCGAVLDGREVLFDSHLRSRSFFRTQEHHPSTGMPPLPYAGPPWRMSETPLPPPRPAPLLGEHNRETLAGLLGRTESEMRQLEAERVIGYEPIAPRTPAVVSLEEQRRQGRVHSYDPDFKQAISQAFHR